MTAVVGAAVFPSRSSTDISAEGLLPAVASRASSQSSILSFSSTSSPRKNQRRCIGKAVASLGGIPFAYTTTAELAEKSRRESVSRRSASGNGTFFRRPDAQKRGESVTKGSFSLKDDRFPWNPHKQQNKVVCAVNHGRIYNSAESAYASESFDENDFAEQNRFHKQSRSSHNFQDYNASFSKYKRSRAPLLSENQQSRLHNEITVFEGIVEPRRSGSDGYRQSDRLRLPDDSATGFGSVEGRGTKLTAEESEHKQSRPKGTLLLSKLEEELSSLQKKHDFQDQIGDAQGSNASISEANRTQANGVQTSSKGKGSQTQMSKLYFDSSAVMTAKSNQGGQYEEENSSPTLAGKDVATSLGQETLPMNEASEANKCEFTSFNLFSSSPSVLQEVNSSYPLHIPLNKSKGPVCRRAPTSLGSRSMPSSRSVTVRNKHYSNVRSQVMNAYDGASKVMKEKQRNLSLGMFDEMNLEDNGLNAQTFSRKEGGVFRDQGKNFRDVETQAENGNPDTLDSSKQRQPRQLHTGTTEKAVTESELWELNVDSSSDVVPLQCNSVAEPHKRFHIHDEYDSEDEMTDVLEPLSDAGTEEDSSLFVKDDLTLLAEHTADLPIQVSLTEIRGDKVSTSVSDAENDMPGLSSSDDVETKNAIDRIQLNCGEGENHPPQSVAAWQKHNTPELPFDFQFSYSETPQRPVLGYRETPFSPFGPPNMTRPWMGGKPTKPSKKKQWVLDSFNPPPNNTKGVKPVEAPGPYPEGQGPKAAKTRKEILGEPLTKEEVVYLVEKSKRESRQLNLGRDGLTHNMLDLIHSYWKRRRVCRIKCKGVPTVDMANVKFHVEDKTGGKIIYQTGGVLYLFRGRNYNYKDRPVIPLMLWKPPPPIYPKLIQPAPEGLTIEEAARLRYLGRKVEPICKLGKNGVYTTLVKDVRGAFKVDDLVRVDCQGLNPSDYKKIGAKLRDLVPCVLLSFDKDNILMWKGNQKTQASMSQALHTETMPDNTCSDTGLSNQSLNNGHQKDSITPMVEDSSEAGEVSNPCATQSMPSIERETIFYEKDRALSVGLASEGGELEQDLALSEALQSEDDLVATISSKGQVDEDKNTHLENVVSVDTLWEHAFQSGMAIELHEEDMDSDLVVRKADELSKSAPLAPIYTIKLMYKLQLKRGPDYKPSDEVRVDFGRGPIKKPKKKFKRNPQLPTISVPGMGGLPVDEIAKLLVKQ